MTRPSVIPRRNVCPRLLGAVATIGGCGFLLLYPLAPADAIPGGDPLPDGGIAPAHPIVVLCSVVVGPMLLTWGTFAVRHRTIAPLTPRRALLAPLLGLVGIAAGAVRYTYEWAKSMPFESVAGHRPDGTVVGETYDVPLHEIAVRELAMPQVVTLAAISALVIGPIAARRGRRRAAVSAVLPVALVIGGSVWHDYSIAAVDVLVLLALASVPFTVGYAATRRE